MEKRTIAKNPIAILLYKDQEDWFDKNKQYNRSELIRRALDTVIKGENDGEIQQD